MSPEQLFTENQKLVPFVYRKYYTYFRTMCPEYMAEDLLQEGYLELWRLCQNFNPDLGNQFSTYAVPCIKGAMTKFVRKNAFVIRLPRSIWESGKRIEFNVLSLSSVAQKGEMNNMIEEVIPGKEDEYPNLTLDLIDDFLKTLTNERDRAIMAEYLYAIVIDREKLNQSSLAEKYSVCQATITNILKRNFEKFQKFIS